MLAEGVHSVADSGNQVLLLIGGRRSRQAPSEREAPGVDRVIHLRTVHLGPDELLVAAKIAVSSHADGADMATTIDDAEARVRDALPSARIIYRPAAR
jgi:divalent metal cation (Fe/Co/Zn/Cd) transporter